MTHRLRRVAMGTVVVFAVLVVVVGFRTGWLSVTDRGRQVGRLRPADLVIDGDETSVAKDNTSSGSSVAVTPTTTIDEPSPTTATGRLPVDQTPPNTSRPPLGDHHPGGRDDDD